MNGSEVSWILPIIISIIALVVSILKISSDKRRYEKQTKINKTMFNTQLDTQRELFQKQLESQKETLAQQLRAQKEAIEKQMLVQREISDKQLRAQQELIMILRKQLAILETGLKEIKDNKRPSDWERAYKQQELELKQKKESWKQIKDLTKFVQFITED